MGRFFTRFSDLLAPSERERLAALKRSGIPQYVRDDVNNTADEYWKISNSPALSQQTFASTSRLRGRKR
jgi:hypothetical protein